jgi:hypothetical protein
MKLLSRIKAFVKPASRKLFAGYSEQALKTRFASPLPNANLPKLSTVASVEASGINAYYVSLLMVADDLCKFQRLMESHFQKIDERTFTDLTVFEYEDVAKQELLIYSPSTTEFNALTLRIMTNSVEFLSSLGNQTFCVPPPWIAFDGYPASWWGGNIQGAQGFYNDNYFLPYFIQLGDAEKQAYFARFQASTEWIEQLTLMYADEC